MAATATRRSKRVHVAHGKKAESSQNTTSSSSPVQVKQVRRYPRRERRLSFKLRQETNSEQWETTRDENEHLSSSNDNKRKHSSTVEKEGACAKMVGSAEAGQNSSSQTNARQKGLRVILGMSLNMVLNCPTANNSLTGEDMSLVETSDENTKSILSQIGPLEVNHQVGSGDVHICYEKGDMEHGNKKSKKNKRKINRPFKREPLDSPPQKKSKTKLP